MENKKSFFIIVLFIFLGKSAFCQNEWFPIGATWYYSYSIGMDFRQLGYAKLEITKDTVISGKNCKLLSKTSVTPDGLKHAFGKEYVYYKDSIVYWYVFDRFQVLYDFSKKIGDTIFIATGSKTDSFCRVKVDSFGSVNINGLQHRIIYTKNLGPSWFICNTTIEKIGNLNYFFPIYSLGCDASCISPLRCYQDEFEYYKLSNWACDTILTGIEAKIKVEFNIYPNPCKDILNIAYPGNLKISKVYFFNSFGQLVKKTTLTSENSTINIRDLMPGLYLVKFLSDNKIITKQIIKVD